MADEAVLRIVLQEATGGKPAAAPSTTTTTAAPPPPSATVPTPAAATTAAVEGKDIAQVRRNEAAAALRRAATPPPEPEPAVVPAAAPVPAPTTAPPVVAAAPVPAPPPVPPPAPPEDHWGDFFGEHDKPPALAEIDAELERLDEPEAPASAPVAARRGGGEENRGTVSDVLGQLKSKGGLTDAVGEVIKGLGSDAIPIAAVAVIADQVSKAVVGGIKGTVGAVGGAASAIASPNDDPSVPIARLGDAASKTGEKISAVLPGLGYMATAAGEVGKALADLMQNLDKTAERYGEYSPEIAQAQAMADVNRTLGEIRRAAEAAPELARYVQLRGELQQRFEDIKIKLLVRIVAIVNPILEGVEKAMAAGEDVIRVVQAIASPLGVIAGAAAKIANLMEDEKIPDSKDPTDILLEGRMLVPNFPNAEGYRE